MHSTLRDRPSLSPQTSVVLICFSETPLNDDHVLITSYFTLRSEICITKCNVVLLQGMTVSLHIVMVEFSKVIILLGDIKHTSNQWCQLSPIQNRQVSLLFCSYADTF